MPVSSPAFTAHRGRAMLRNSAPLAIRVEPFARKGLAPYGVASLLPCDPAIIPLAIMRKEQSEPKGLLPLVVAVTGHRDLSPDEVPHIVQQVRALFIALNDRYPHTPILLLSSLAEGADRLVAHTALECGAELYVVLPME